MVIECMKCKRRSLIAVAPAVGGEALTDKDLWDNSCITRWQLERWTGEDLAKHSVGIRHTIKFLLARLDALAAQPTSPLRGRESIRQILNDHFWTGEPGQHGAIEAAASVLASPPEQPAANSDMQPLFAVSGQYIFQRPVRKGSNVSMGFSVCKVEDGVDPAELCAILNKGEPATDGS